MREIITNETGLVSGGMIMPIDLSDSIQAVVDMVGGWEAYLNDVGAALGANG